VRVLEALVENGATAAQRARLVECAAVSNLLLSPAAKRSQLETFWI
jgi:hypothetical protein